MKLETLPGLGPRTARRLKEVGIENAEQLCQLGAIEAFARLKFHDPQNTSLNALWALAGAVDGRDWRRYDNREKQALMTAFALRQNP